MGNIGKNLSKKIDDKLTNLDKGLENLTAVVNRNDEKQADFNSRLETRIANLEIDKKRQSFARMRKNSEFCKDVHESGSSQDARESGQTEDNQPAGRFRLQSQQRQPQDYLLTPENPQKQQQDDWDKDNRLVRAQILGQRKWRRV